MLKKSTISFVTQVKKNGEIVIGKSIVIAPKGDCSGETIKWLEDKYKSK